MDVGGVVSLGVFLFVGLEFCLLFVFLETRTM